ncbi:uncharacterized protein LOC134209860 [Armigeres subalbatus]|uniref:uncharacterized protein LOC134209860 n=1 Tax=Armigeres subalbatus TaxID=124917 RepID=UPI002ED664EC
MLMQLLWLQPCRWDDEVSSIIADKWENYIQQLPMLNDFRVPHYNRTERKVLSDNNKCSTIDHAVRDKFRADLQGTKLTRGGDISLEKLQPIVTVQPNVEVTKVSGTSTHNVPTYNSTPLVHTNTSCTTPSSQNVAANLYLDAGSFLQSTTAQAAAAVQLMQPIATSGQQQNFGSPVLPGPAQPSTSYCQVEIEQPSISTKMLTGLSPAQSAQFEPDAMFVNHEEVMYYTPAAENQAMSNLQIAGGMSYEQMKADLKEFIEHTVGKVVEKSFQTNFARFAALLEIEKKDDSATSSSGDAVERHTRINTEEELIAWNIKLNNKELCRSYLDYFSKIIIPNAYNEKGDNACYIIVDCLFTRDFWTTMTWTGISRGNKAKRGFRECGNVTKLLCSIAQIGDPLYTATKLEMFCRNRLFRYCKSRASNRQLRKSACRKRRSLKSQVSTPKGPDDVADYNSNDSDVSENIEQKAECTTDDDIGEESNDGSGNESSTEDE